MSFCYSNPLSGSLSLLDEMIDHADIENHNQVSNDRLSIEQLVSRDHSAGSHIGEDSKSLSQFDIDTQDLVESLHIGLDPIRDTHQHRSKQTKYRFLLHQNGFDINGCVPSDSPKPYIDTEAMDDQPTQQLTQQYDDPRKSGAKSMLNLQDEADVLCILLPTSGPALKAVRLVADTAPQHILQNHGVDGITESSYEPNVRESTTPSIVNGSPSASVQTTTASVSERTKFRPAKDIALRMSSKLRDLRLGFVFGRNPSRCDLIIADNVDKVSNCHFRIFLNQNGVLMLEDTSTNGTYVEKTLLLQRQRDYKGDPCPKMRMLSNGSIIGLPTKTSEEEEWLRFVVRMPPRNHALQQYQQNLAAYLRYIQQAERQAKVAAAAKGRLPPVPHMPFNPLNQELEEHSPQASMLAAATGEYNHGMHWNGGEKFRVVSYIGKGAFATVFKVSTADEGDVYAAKQIEKRRFIKDGRLGSKVHHEISIMERLRHPNIVQFIEYHETPSHVYIIMEYVSMGDLTTYTGSGTAMNEYTAQVMASQICGALKYLHEQKITHRDIKPDNILMASAGPYTFKLSDFGLSKIVKDEETFLKTFCGTILYCAPEIYPGFQRIKMGMPPKRSRHWEHPREETLPYKHSVDTWGIAAVLFHLLCGRPAWTGTTENQGLVMLENIMGTPVDWERLEQAGVSGLGIDFLQRMLVIEPTDRATEAQQLQHAWIRQVVSAEDSKMANDNSNGGEDPGLDASQLSLADADFKSGSSDDADEKDDARRSKRLKEWLPPPAWNDSDGHPRRPQEQNDDDAPPWGAEHPAWDLAQRGQNQPGHGPGNNRLFGEISESALRSSGALGQTAINALGIPLTGNHDHGGLGLGGYSNISSVDPNYPAPESLSANLDFPLPPRGTNNHRQLQIHAQRQQQFHEPFPGSSLLGAEALVDQLNMASPKSGVSGPSADSRDLSDKASYSREVSPSRSGSKRSSHQFHSPGRVSTPKKARTADRRSSASSSAPPSKDGDTRRRPSSRHHEQQSTHNDIRTRALARYDQGNILLTRKSSYDSQQESRDDAQRIHRRSKSGTPLLPTTFNSQETDEASLAEPKKASSLPSPRAPNPPAADTPPAALPRSGAVVDATGKRDKVPFKEPPFRFGNLVPVSGSIPTVSIKVANQINSFGRDPASTFPHPDLKEDRVPKNAMDVTMHYPGIEQDIDKGSTKWHLREDLTAIISTRTTRYIKINGVRLMRGNNCWLYGKLHTGDIITIFEAPEGRQPKNDAEKQFLKFRCEFFVGASKSLRSEDNPFVVLKEEQQYRESELKKSHEEATHSASGSI